MFGEILPFGLLAFCLIPVAFVCYSVIPAATSPLRNVPGPFLARFTRLWFFQSTWRGQAHWENIHLHRKYAPAGSFYAPVVRLGPNLYSISRPESVVYGISSKMPKTSFYNTFKHPDMEPGLLAHRNIRKHAEMRRKFQSMYSMSSLLRYEKYVETTQDVFQQRLGEMVKSGKTVNMHRWIQCYAFDVVGNITYNKRFGFLDEGKDIDHALSSLHAQTVYGTLAGIYSWAHPILYRILEQMPGSGAAGRTFLMKFAQRRVSEREIERAAEEKDGKRHIPADGAPRDFLDLAIDAERDPEKNMTKFDVFAVGLANILAGSDTTAISLSSVFWHLTTTPRAMQRLRAELDQAIAEGKMLGHFFPEGTEIGINSWVAHYDEDIWGSDATSFKPERWIESDAAKLKLMDSYFMPFGLGSRTCIGRHISMLEMCKVIPMVISQFDFDLVDRMERFETVDIFLVKPKDFRVVVRARSQ
ncbi:hypothetical protein M409DRAFT_64291 [Zasmidium cellare ATCC 36951]|uniref:Cytochrome P450 n=1 Tax=Zasmidium cellare ATCC 36951 TaxID=1080233 RepID=A0A6A6CV68_ZASCE|nr:uncharacterized protein M409DRAFT_64291 [Zasmidium cellare ATCC 36951]KAF2170613.1 hypothetical protein M409DRAFT_64291 [Zasmidium cellare ATCC 36951]